jgi:hypothetical protein
MNCARMFTCYCNSLDYCKYWHENKLNLFFSGFMRSAAWWRQNIMTTFKESHIFLVCLIRLLPEKWNMCRCGTETVGPLSLCCSSPGKSCYLSRCGVAIRKGCAAEVRFLAAFPFPVAWTGPGACLSLYVIGVMRRGRENGSLPLPCTVVKNARLDTVICLYCKVLY